MSEIDDALSGSGSEIDTLLGPEKKSSGIIRRAIGDTGVSIAKGVIGVPEAAIGLADIVTGGYAGKIAEDAGFRPKQARHILDSLLSPEQQEANQTLAEAKGFGPTIAAAVQNPSTIFHAGVESAPSMLGGGAIARAAMKVAPLTPLAAGALGEGAVSAGQMAEQVRQETPTGTLTPGQAAIATASGVVTGVLGRLGGAVAQKLGITDIDTLLAGGVVKGTDKGLIRRAVEGAIAEGVLEELPQSAQEQIAQNVALGRPWNDGVSEAAAMGMLVGGMIGGGTGVLSKAPEATALPGAAAPPAAESTEQPAPSVSMPGDHPEVQASNGPISAAARVAIDTGASAQEQVKNLSVEAEEHQQEASKGKFGPEEEAKALAAIEKQSDADMKAMRDFTPEPTRSHSDAPASEVERMLNNAAVAEADAERETLFPFATEKAALKQAREQTKLLGEEHHVVPHPNAPGRFAAVLKPPIDAQAHEAATSPQNDRPEPTPAQAEAGNYKKGHARIAGLDISIENPEGSKRKPQWPALKSHYGYIRGSVGKDKDHVDAFVKPGTPEDFTGTVFVVDQRRADGAFDEHKVMLGYADIDEAKAGYRENYKKGWRGLGAITSMPMDEFKAWVRDPEQTLAPAAPTAQDKAASVQHTPVADANPATPAKDRIADRRDGTSTVPATAAQTTPSKEGVPVSGLHVEYQGQRHPVASFEDASRKWDEFRAEATKRGAGASDIGRARVVDADGKEVATIAYNGSVTPTKPPEKAAPTARAGEPMAPERSKADLLNEAREKYWDHELTEPGRQELIDQAGLKLAPKVKWRYAMTNEKHALGKLIDARRAAPAAKPSTAAAEIKPTAEVVPIEKKRAARPELKGKTVTRTVKLEDGSTATLTMKAEEAITDMDERIASVEELLRCVA